MIAVSNDFKNAMKQPVKELKAYIETDGEQITSNTDLIGFKISAEAGMCKTAMRKCEIKLLSDHSLLDKEISLFSGVKLASGEYEYANYGRFLIVESNIQKDTGVTTLVGYDQMIKTSIEYEPQHSFPMTVYELAQEVCLVCGIELGTTDLVNGDWMIDIDLYQNINGTTYRDVIQQIAEATASTAIIGVDNKLYFKYIGEIEDTLEYSNLFSLKLEPKYGEINSVVLSRSPQEDNVALRNDDSIAEHGLTEFKIVNNEIVDKNREEAIAPIYNELIGTQYYPFEATTEGLGWFEIGDRIVLINDAGEEFETIIYNLSLDLKGSLKEKLYTKADTKAETNYARAGGISKRIKNTEIIVDKQNHLINNIVEETDALNYQTMQLQIELDRITNTFERIGGSNKIKNSVGLITETDDNSFWINSNTGDLVLGYAQELLGTTESASKISMRNEQRTTTDDNITGIVIGKEIYFSYKLKNEENTTTKIRLTNSNGIVVYENIVTEVVNYQTYEHTFTPTTSSMKLELFSTTLTNGWSHISDLMLGDSLLWEMAPSESWSRVVEMNQHGILIKSALVNTAIFLGLEGMSIHNFSNNTVGDKIGFITKDGILTNLIEYSESVQKNLISKSLEVDNQDLYVRYVRRER